MEVALLILVAVIWLTVAVYIGGSIWRDSRPPAAVVDECDECKEPLTEHDRHHVVSFITVRELRLEYGEGMAAVGDYCAKHCPGARECSQRRRAHFLLFRWLRWA